MSAEGACAVILMVVFGCAFPPAPKKAPRPGGAAPRTPDHPCGDVRRRPLPTLTPTVPPTPPRNVSCAIVTVARGQRRPWETALGGRHVDNEQPADHGGARTRGGTASRFRHHPLPGWPGQLNVRRRQSHPQRPAARQTTECQRVSATRAYTYVLHRFRAAITVTTAGGPARATSSSSSVHPRRSGPSRP